MSSVCSTESSWFFVFSPFLFCLVVTGSFGLVLGHRLVGGWVGYCIGGWWAGQVWIHMGRTGAGKSRGWELGWVS